MLEPVHHIEYYFEKGKGWVPEVIRTPNPNLSRQASKAMNFGFPMRYTYGNVIVNYPHTVLYYDDI